MSRPLLVLSMALVALPACTLNVASVNRDISDTTSARPSIVSADLTLPDDALDDLSVVVRGSTRSDALATATLVGLRGGAADEVQLTADFALYFRDEGIAGSPGLFTLDIVTPPNPIEIWMDRLTLDLDSGAALTLVVAHQAVDISAMAAGIEVVSTSGSMHVETTGAAVLSSASGSMVVSAGSGELINQSGNLILDVARGANASTVSGSIEGQIGDGGVFLTVSGSMDLELTAAPTRELSLTASSGSIILTVPRGAPISFDLETTGGAVMVTLDGRSEGGRRFVGQTGGGGPLVRIRTESGSIVVRD